MLLPQALTQLVEFVGSARCLTHDTCNFEGICIKLLFKLQQLLQLQRLTHWSSSRRTPAVIATCLSLAVTVMSLYQSCKPAHDSIPCINEHCKELNVAIWLQGIAKSHVGLATAPPLSLRFSLSSRPTCFYKLLK